MHKWCMGLKHITCVCVVCAVLKMCHSQTCFRLALCAVLKMQIGIVCLSENADWHCVPFWKCRLALCAVLKMQIGIVCLSENADWHCVPFWKCRLALCAFLKMQIGIVCLSENADWHCVPFWKCRLALCAFLKMYHSETRLRLALRAVLIMCHFYQKHAVW